MIHPALFPSFAPLSPSFTHVADAPQYWLTSWQILGIIATATGQVFIRHAGRKARGTHAGYSLTVYDADAHAIYRCALPNGILTLLRGIERKNPGRIHVLSSTEFVHPDRSTVCVAARVSCTHDYYAGLTD
jgi:hypothetical protein